MPSPHPVPSVAGLLLAAGAGRRMGRPKALVDGWLVHAVGALREGGCDPVVVVLGAAAEEARTRLVGQDVEVVVAGDWDEGMGASLRAGLRALPEGPDAVLVTLVDLPDVGAPVVERLLGRLAGARTLARAAYAGVPGHPVLLGREHWTGVIGTATADRGARDHLAAHEVELVECGDLATGHDVDSETGSAHGHPTGGQPSAE